ncbi:hypothetical protein [Lysobacter terrae]
MQDKIGLVAKGYCRVPQERCQARRTKSPRLNLYPLALLGSCLVASTTAAAQNMTCGNAVMQLQAYIAQVNQYAAMEQQQGIPMRCGWNQQCSQWWYAQLNNWYWQQSQLVNNWYNQISMTCGNGQEMQTQRGEEMDDDVVDEIEVDDEDKTVAIKIPSTPKGYNRRRSYRGQ